MLLRRLIISLTSILFDKLKYGSEKERQKGKRIANIN
jgi:hypothetical protein